MSETETPAKKDPPMTPKAKGTINDDDAAFKHVTENRLNLTPEQLQDLQDVLRFQKIPTLSELLEFLLTDDIDKNLESLKPYKVGNKSHQLTNPIITKLRLLAYWTLYQQSHLQGPVTNADWMVLTRADYDQGHIRTPSLERISGHPPPQTTQPFTPSIHSTPSSNMSSHSIVSTSMFADIADNFDDWNLASIFELPNDDADIIPSPDPHFHAQNHNSVNPPDAHGLSHTSVHLSAQNGEQLNGCNIKIIGDPDKDTKKTFVGTDKLDKETKKKIGGINNQEITVLPLMVHLYDTSHCSSVTKSLDPYHHGEDSPTDLSTIESPKQHNMGYTSMNTQTLLSPLHHKCYNMAQECLFHVATLTKKMEHHNEFLNTSFISSYAHLCPKPSAPSYDVTGHFNQDSSLDTNAYHTKAQDSLRSEYFEAFRQLQSHIAQKQSINSNVACLN